MLDEKHPHDQPLHPLQTPATAFPAWSTAKSDAQVCGVDPALQHANVTLLTNAYVSRLETEPCRPRSFQGASSSATAPVKNIPPISSSSPAAPSIPPRCCCARRNDQHPQRPREPLGRRRASLHGTRQLGVDGDLEMPQSDDISKIPVAQRLLFRLRRTGTIRWDTSPSSASSTPRL